MIDYEAIKQARLNMKSEEPPTQSEVAKALKKDRQYINGLEAGRFSPSIKFLEEYAEYTGVPIQEFFK
jgi:transcriptional regulator with XRE-family HTH domain